MCAWQANRRQLVLLMASTTQRRFVFSRLFLILIIAWLARCAHAGWICSLLVIRNGLADQSRLCCHETTPLFSLRGSVRFVRWPRGRPASALTVRLFFGGGGARE